jgi:hypothetical protein
MNLALILGLFLWTAGWLPPTFRGSVRQAAAQTPATASSDSSQTASPTQAQTPPSQGAQPAQPLPSPTATAQAPNSPAQAKPTPARARREKTIPPNCSEAPTALNTAAGKATDTANSTAAGSTDLGSTNPESTNVGSTAAVSTSAGSTNADSTGLKPCPPPKKVVRNGGSSEPKVQLTGGTAAQQASDKSSTEQLRAATQENLKKAAGLQLTPSQRDMVSQIKEFMAQSKAAVAAGDLEGAHNLALKAHLLSVELVKP